ncbi:DUF3768 domain-containing protein [Sphingomonas sp. 2R-10]|uniref:DUF3768 domain-containing protein n=1 Tax=Sphingomonas sp. 2R-10 TaxID=3045148 RepID=UPI0024BAFF2A|nr:DUF3768 domain-containing protein [Sphingomonas sp. 2R-10]MDJ0275989.1 DUF3768 domain-containing protein [Sphingomonas sp. 2R-10]
MAEQTPQSGRAKGGASEIACHNDWLREHIHAPGHNRVVMTSGIAALIGDVSLFRNFHKRAELMRAIRDYDSFYLSIDPYGERDMGKFEFEGTDCYWKIDYYNPDLTAGSEDPADPSRTTRVLTIMRVDER